MAVIAVIVVAFGCAKWNADSKSNPEISSPTSDCDVSAFVEEYNLSLSRFYDDNVVYNDVSYRLIYDDRNKVHIPIVDSTCSMQTDKATAEEVLTHNYLANSLYSYDVLLYRDLAICYGVSWGSQHICAVTSGTSEAIEHPVVDAATEHERETISVVNRLAPNGWKEETVGATRGLIRLTKELKGPGALAIAFDVADTSACFLKDSVAVSIYDYSLTIGDDIWYRLKNRNSFTGSDQDLHEVNSALQELMNHPDAPSYTSNAAAALLGGNNCLEAGKYYGAQLASINQKIEFSRSSGQTQAYLFSQWISPMKAHAEAVRSDVLNKTNASSLFSIEGHIVGVLLLTKALDYLEAKQHYDTANGYFDKGLFYSAEEEYQALSVSAEKLKSTSLLDYVLSGFLWLLVLVVVVVVFLLVKNQPSL